MSDYSNLLRKLRTDPKAFEAEAADAIDALLLRLHQETSRADAQEQRGDAYQLRMAKLDGELRIKSEFLSTRQCPDHSGKWERGRCLQCELETALRRLDAIREVCEDIIPKDKGPYAGGASSLARIILKQLDSAVEKPLRNSDGPP